MSDEEKKKEKIEEKTNDNPKENKAIGINVAQLIAEKDQAIELLRKATDKIEELEGEKAALEARVNEDTKAALITKIAPMTTMPTEFLAQKDVEELMQMEKILSGAKIPTFNAGTPLKTVSKSPEAQLANAFDEYASKTWRKT